MDVVTLAGIHPKLATVLGSANVNRPIAVRAFERRWFIRHKVAAVNELLQLAEAVIQAADRSGSKTAAACVLRKRTEGPIPQDRAFKKRRRNVAGVAGADRVNAHAVPLRGLDGLLQGSFAGVVLAVADHHQHSGDRLGFWPGSQLVGPKRDGIPQRRPAGRSHTAD